MYYFKVLQRKCCTLILRPHLYDYYTMILHKMYIFHNEFIKYLFLLCKIIVLRTCPASAIINRRKIHRNEGYNVSLMG